MSNLIRRRSFWDLIFSLALMLAMVVVLMEAGKAKSSPFDELGSAFFPTALALIIIILSVPVTIRSLLSVIREQAAARNSPPEPDTGPSAATVMQVMLISLLTIIYVGGIALRVLPFSILTAGFLIFGILALREGEGRLRGIVWLVLGSIIFGFLMEYMFTKVFIMDLPAFQLGF